MKSAATKAMGTVSAVEVQAHKSPSLYHWAPKSLPKIAQIWAMFSAKLLI
jgi:hypothetical protein